MTLRHLLLATTALLPLAVSPALAGPNGPTVVGGAATVLNPGTANVTVNQSTDKAIINWHAFDVGANESIRFNQPAASSIILNRVTGGLGPSQILGVLDANGRVFVINRDGILFGPNSKVNAASFLATTHDIRNDDFMAGRFNFSIPGRPDASIVNLGSITAANGGFAALVAPGVRNSGTITATLGTVSLAAGNTFSLDFYGDKLITLAVGDEIASSVKDVATGLPLKSLVTNDGKIKANGGRVELTAASARQVVDSVINTSGVIEANTIGTHNGTIVLGAATATTKTAGAPKQTVKISGKIKAAGKKPGTKGGTVIVTGETIEVANATIDVSGPAAGGKVLIGGDWGGGKPDTSLVSNPSAVLETFAVPTASWVSVDAATTINASATQTGNGGKVILWSDQYTSFAGTILALGGAQIGNGGFAEVSSHGVLNYTGIADLRATNGKFGSLLLDPYNIIIGNAADNTMSSGPTFTPSSDSSYLNVTTLANALALSNVLVTTGGTGSPGVQPGNITVDSYTNLTWSSGSTLTLSAYGNIFLSYGATITNTGAGNLILRADNSGTGTGTISFYPTTPHIDFTNSTGKVAFYYNPTGGYTSPTDFTANLSLASPSQFTAYMLVNNANNLVDVANNLAGTYALGKDIDASSVANFKPLGDVSPTQFTGIFDGNGGLGLTYAISNLHIAPITSTTNVGLFGYIGTTGIVRNLTITNASVTADPNTPPPGQFIGVLAGNNAGTISNVAVSGVVTTNGAPLSGVIAGGLVGQNGDARLNHPGTITSSAATVNITLGGAISSSQMNTAGGLVGVNIPGGTITNSQAFGTLTATGPNVTLGGLVGTNNGTISGSTQPAANQTCTTGQSCATGTIATVLGTNAGGLVGFNTGTVTNSFATGAVTIGDTTLYTGMMASFGGLIGNSSGPVTGSFATGNVTATLSPNSSNYYTSTFLTLGGLIGTSSAAVSNSFATGNVSVTLNISSTNCCFYLTSLALGGLIGQQTGSTVSSTYATGAVTATWNVDPTNTSFYGYSFGNTFGGLIGTSTAAVTDSHATGAVTINNGTATAGGLIGEQSTGAVTNVYATGNVTINANANSPYYFYAAGSLGGLIGEATDTAVSTAHANGAVAWNLTGSNALNLAFYGYSGGLIGSTSAGSITNSFATGAVTGPSSTSYFIAGGLVGLALGTPIDSSHANGNVTGGTTGGYDTTYGFYSYNYTGGLVGVMSWGYALNGSSYTTSPGQITNSYATGNVTGWGETGGLVGLNYGNIINSYATGNVTGLAHSFNQTYSYTYTDPFTGQPVTYSYNYSYNPAVGGLVGDHGEGTISNSYATGAVTGRGYIGGLVGLNSSAIESSHANGAVTESAPNNDAFNSTLGGFVGTNFGTVKTSQAFGPVTGGDKAIVGGFVGVNAITISDSTATGNVIGSTNGYLGGFAGMNFGLIQNSTSNGNVTGTGDHNVAGGLVGINFGYIDPSQSTGNVTSGPNSIVGGFVGANAAVRFDDGSQFIGTISPDSNGTGQATAGPNSTVGPQVGQNYPTSGVPDLPNQTCTGVGLCGATLFNPNGQDLPQSQITVNPEFISPLLVVAELLTKNVDFNTPPDNLIPSAPKPNGPSGTHPNGPQTGPQSVHLPSGMPPLNETRFINNEVMLQIAGNATPEQVREIAQKLGLEIITQETFGLLGRTVYRFRITSGISVRQAIHLLELNKLTAQAQPIYVFELSQTQTDPAPANNEGDSAQYIVSKLHLPEVHKLATGKDVLVAVVDSAIDVNHPDLQGVIAGKFDSANADEKPHPHGTGMAGAIASHKRLIGIAPNAKLLAIQAFGVNSGSAQGTSMNIVKGLNWAVEQGAKVVNMSFAGPMDPILQQAIKAMHDKGIVLIAAAGNAGPKSPPLYPGADPNVIAVSATDADDATYKNANRGKYIALAAPGVDILVPAPDGGYQLTTGTSVAAAHISGVAALLLERNPSLKPDQIRKLLTSTADKPPGSRPEDIGAGLVDPLKALEKLAPKSAEVQ